MQLVQCFDHLFALQGLPDDQIVSHLALRGLETVVNRKRRDLAAVYKFERNGKYYDLYQGEDAISQQQPLPVLLEMIANRIRVMVSYLSEEYSFIQGDSVKAPGGDVIVLAGPSFTGQTTLAQVLVEQGADPWSSSYVVIDDHGHALPFPASHQPRKGSGVAVGGVLLLNHLSDSSLQAEEISAGQMALFLTQLAMDDRSNMQKGMARIGGLCESSRFRIRGNRGSSEEVANLLKERVRWHS